MVEQILSDTYVNFFYPITSLIVMAYFFCGGRKRNINSNQQIFVLDDQNNIFTTHSKNACVGL